MQSESSRAALKGALQANRLVGMKGDNWDNHAVAQNILEDETGHFSDSLLPQYSFDETIRDRLLAHGRQDAAHAMANTASILRRLHYLERQVSMFGAVTVGLLVAIVWKLWH